MKMSELVSAVESAKGKKVDVEVRVPAWLERESKARLTGTMKATYASKSGFTKKKGSRAVLVPVTILVGKGSAKHSVRLQDLTLA
jgi:hypothetical protein